MKKHNYLLLSLLLITGCNNINIETSSSIISSESTTESYSSEESSTTKETSSTNESTTETISSSVEQSEEISSSESISISDSDSKEDIACRNNTSFRLSSIHDYQESSGVVTYKTTVPYDDTYTINYKSASSIKVFDENYTLLASGVNTLEVKLNKDEIVYVQLASEASKAFDLTVSYKSHTVELPYDILEDNQSYEITGDNTKSPTQEIEVKYTKRTDSRSMYVNCNNPEALTTNELNKCLTKQYITNKDVFFTFEHNNIASKQYYYGYRVTNTSKEDLYVTVKNLGYQYNGSGSWLGEDEWTKFYNIAFRSKIDYGTSSANSNYKAYVGFCNTYKSDNRKPITYRIPSGKYIYVIGGTTADAYDKINVFKSANLKVNGGCANGAVLFSTNGGSATGQFVVYDNVTTLEKNIANELGYMVTRDGKNVGSQYVGYDDCHGVVDASFTWTINDKTKSGSLPVTYQNPYYTSSQSGTAYSKITKFVTKTNNLYDTWVTHINPNNTAEAVGTDMTFYKTIDNATKEEITIDYLHYDGKGSLANIGNWMVDYQDHFTIINQGNNDRTFTYNMTHNGVILGFVRDEDGYIDSSFSPKYWTSVAASTYGSECRDYFTYTITIKAHSIAKFTVDYNLLANSCGYIKHSTSLN